MKLSLNIFGRTISFGAGKPQPVSVRKVQAPAYGRMFRTAQTDRLTGDWKVALTSADAEILVSQVQMRARHRQLERDDALFRHILRLFQNNVVGHDGICIEMKAHDAQDNLLLKQNKLTKKAWQRFCGPKNFTVRRNLSCVQVQRLAIRALKRDGGILFRLHRGFQNEFGFAIEPIEIDRLDHNWNKPVEWAGNRIRFGVELDAYGAPVAYWILKRHPGDVFAYSSSSTYRERVPAADIIALWDIERAEQTVGYSDMCSVGTSLHHLEEYIISENVAARLGADQGGWFEQDPNASPDAMSGPTDDAGNKIVEREPGMWEILPVGYRAKQNAPVHPTAAFPFFLKANQRLASIGANISYNAAAGDLEAVNYSSLKAGRLEDIEEYQTLQCLLMDTFLTPLAEEWLPFAILSGNLQMPMTMIDTLKDGITWQPRTWKSVEPLKEVQADIAEIEAGLSSRSEKIRERGGDRETIDEEQMHDKQSEADHDLQYGQPKATMVDPSMEPTPEPATAAG